MSNAALYINNETTSYLSLDIMLGGAPTSRVIRARLAPAGQTGYQVDVGDITTLEELNATPSVRYLLDSSPPKISFTVVRGSNDVPGAIDQVATASTLIGNGGFYRIHAAFAAGAGGAPDDVVIANANFPFAAVITDVQLMITTAVAGNAQLRSAAAGGGNTLSAANSTAAAGRVRDPGTGATGGSGVRPAVARNGTIILRRSDSAAAGMVIIDFERTS